MSVSTADCWKRPRRPGVLLAAAIVLAASPVFGQPGDPTGDLVTPQAQQAIDKGLAYLAANQHADGSFGSGSYRGNIAVTSLCGMAFMAGGNTPGRGKYGDHVDRALEYVLANTTPSGFITVPAASSHGPMYEHGFGTLFLAECYGMSHRSDLRDKLTRAVNLIIRTQNAEGGWRYQPVRRDADISVTITQIMALRAARNAGISVPKDTVDRTIKYVKGCQNADGGFRYMIHGGQSAFPRSAAGVVSLYSAGIYEGPAIEKGLEYLRNQRPRGEEALRSGRTHYFYGHYYAVQAMWHAGSPYWEEWYPAISGELLRSQHPEGYWVDSVCAEFGTAMACLILQMPNNYLPIFQR
jgi:hypothetical protein